MYEGRDSTELGNLQYPRSRQHQPNLMSHNRKKFVEKGKDALCLSFASTVGLLVLYQVYNRNVFFVPIAPIGGSMQEVVT